VGKSNLHDYVCRNFNHALTISDYGNPWEKVTMIRESGPVAAGQLTKIGVGIDLAGDSIIVDLYNRVKNRPQTEAKDFDIIFRGSVKKETIVYYLRKDIEPILKQMEQEYKIIIPDKRVPPDEYYREMFRSKICVSPFGFGEVCWRDFESVLCRSLLVKPDMSHVESNPNIFRPHKTYVPVMWDYSDLKEKCEYYLKNEEKRQRIVMEAFNVMDDFYKNGEFVNYVKDMMSYLRGPASQAGDVTI
jgi:hypothetical protein